MELSDAQWEIVKPHFVVEKKGRGRPRRDERQVLEGILWVLRTGARWKDLPREFPPYQTCHRRFTAWVRDDSCHPELALHCIGNPAKAASQLQAFMLLYLLEFNRLLD